MSRWFVPCLFVVSAFGCGPTGPTRVIVTGTVTYNGEPVGEGNILFLDPTGQTAVDGGPIVNGRYSVEVLPGMKRVEIRAARAIPGTSDAIRGGRPALEEFVPPGYHRDSKLTVEVTPEGPNVFDFPMTGKK
jgi:hypothetical protein